MHPFLSIKNVNIGYNKVLIENIKAELFLGEVCLIVGNNGVGKTTLIKSILGQIPLLKGEITIDKKSITAYNTKEIAEKMAIVFSTSNLPQHYTTKDLISLGKYIHYPFYFNISNKDKEDVEQIIKDVQLQQYQDVLLQKLSDGNLQKAFIGRALAQNSPIIILDEPTTHLDEENKIVILSLLRKLAKDSQKIILFSSHDWRLAKEFSDKIWYTKDGQLFAGFTEDILSQHQDLTQPILFHFNQEFLPPRISAPPFQKELMFSVLQKNFKKDMTNVSFEYKNGNWELRKDGILHSANYFSDIINLLRNLL